MGLMVAVSAIAPRVAREVLPSGSVAPLNSSVKATVPVRFATPAVNFTDAVRATARPAIPGFGMDERAVDVWVRLTDWVMTSEAAELRLLLPAQDAVMV